jgi:molybdenum cofactor cytidylyltransferase
MLAAVILSGGGSSRMGSPKALIPFRGSTFLEHLLAVIHQSTKEPAAEQRAPDEPAKDKRVKDEPSPKSSEVSNAIGCTRVVVGAHTDEITAKVPLAADEVVVNPHWQQGQLSSIQAAIRSLAKVETDGVILFLVDHPMISAELVSKLVRQFYTSGRSIVLPKFRGKRGHPVIFAARLYDELLAAPEEQGARAVVWAHADEVLEVPTDEEGVVLNLNDPEALRRALGNS